VSSVVAEEFTELDEETELELFTLDDLLDEETATDELALDFNELEIELLTELFTELLSELPNELVDELTADELVSPTTP